MKPKRPAPRGVGGWLLVLCIALLLWHPLSFAATAAGAAAALPIRGIPLGSLLVVRLVVVGLGIASGLRLVRCSPGAVGMAQVALLLSGAMDLVVYATSIFPNNRMPSDTPFYAAGSLIYHAVWLLYLRRSRRIENTFDA